MFSRDIRRVAEAHDLMWEDAELEDMISLFTSSTAQKVGHTPARFSLANRVLYFGCSSTTKAFVSCQHQSSPESFVTMEEHFRTPLWTA